MPDLNAIIDAQAQLAGRVHPMPDYMPVGRAFVLACMAEAVRQARREWEQEHGRHGANGSGTQENMEV